MCTACLIIGTGTGGCTMVSGDVWDVMQTSYVPHNQRPALVVRFKTLFFEHELVFEEDKLEDQKALMGFIQAHIKIACTAIYAGCIWN